MEFSTDETFATTITTPEFAWSNTDSLERGQSQTPTAGGYTSVVDRDYKNRVITGMIPELAHAQRNSLEAFFNTSLEWAKSTFYIRIENDERAATWNPRETPLLCDATIASVTVKCDDLYDGATIKCDQMIGQDYEIFGPCRIQGSGFKVIEKRQGTYDLSLAAVIEHAG